MVAVGKAFARVIGTTPVPQPTSRARPPACRRATTSGIAGSQLSDQAVLVDRAVHRLQRARQFGTELGKGNAFARLEGADQSRGHREQSGKALEQAAEVVLRRLVGQEQGVLVGQHERVGGGVVLDVAGARHHREPFLDVPGSDARALGKRIDAQHPGSGHGLEQAAPIADEQQPCGQGGADVADQLQHELGRFLLVHRALLGCRIVGGARRIGRGPSYRLALTLVRVAAQNFGVPTEKENEDERLSFGGPGGRRVVCGSGRTRDLDRAGPGHPDVRVQLGRADARQGHPAEPRAAGAAPSAAGGLLPDPPSQGQRPVRHGQQRQADHRSELLAARAHGDEAGDHARRRDRRPARERPA